nr:hypothetical protein Iba_scaffold1483857CG0010 [Ipomoea batatas]GME02460.1 hypothetical protein Iba_scaffold103CG0010 [Ipomoea batatas]GME02468.1 hypothetical protein Iba_scaffold108CG0010 [Ipomoea batatas]
MIAHCDSSLGGVFLIGVKLAAASYCYYNQFHLDPTNIGLLGGVWSAAAGISAGGVLGMFGMTMYIEDVEARADGRPTQSGAYDLKADEVAI